MSNGQVQTLLGNAFGAEWSILDDRAQREVIADFRALIADPEKFGYDPMLANYQLAKEYRDSVGGGNLRAYSTVLANSGPLYGKADTSQCERLGREYLESLAEEAIGMADSDWLMANPEFYQVRNHANILADGLLPECGHSVTNAVKLSGEYWACGSHEHPYTGEQVLLYLTPYAAGRHHDEHIGPMAYCEPDARPLIDVMIDAGMESLAREHLRALAQRHIGQELTRLFIEVPDDASAQLSALKLYQHHADILADGILPECGHPVRWATVHGQRGWVCGFFVVEDAEELYPTLDITLALFR